MEKDFKDFDQFTKICSNRFCRKEFKSEEYYHLDNKCSTCGGVLNLKNKVEEETSQKIKDRESSIKLIKELNDHLEKMKDIVFPDFITLKENSEKIFGKDNKEEDDKSEEEDLSDIDAREVDYIDYKLEFVRFKKEFFY